MCGRCVEDAQDLYGRCMEGWWEVQNISGKCIEGTQVVHGRLIGGMWMAACKYFKEVLGIKSTYFM